MPARGTVGCRARALAALVVVLSLGVGGLPATSVAATRTCALKPTRADTARLRDLRQSRPRLLARPAELGRVAALSQTDSWAAEERLRLRRQANRIVNRPPAGVPRVGGRLQFQEYRNRLVILGLAWHLEGDERYVVHAEAELLAAARMPNWNPAIFLDTAEVTSATAVGYDWFADAMSSATRRVVAAAIVNLGLRPAKCFYRKGEGPTARTNNWGIVTNAGMAMGAIAVADSHPTLAAAVLGGALEHVSPALRQFGADGFYPEGIGYWRYATLHAVKLLATLKSSFGSTFGLAAVKGLRQAGNFPLRAIGPTGKPANFSDSAERLPSMPQLYWLARHYGRPIDAWTAYQHSQRTSSPLYLLWYTPKRRAPRSAGVGPSTIARSLGSAYLRSRWGDPNAAFLGVKGGRNDAGHAHRELGSFVFDLHGQRWAMDLGPDDYALPGYFDHNRNGRYYRLSARGQNTLTVGGGNQRYNGRARVVRSSTRRKRSHLVLDLSQAYRAHSVRRGVALLGGNTVVVQDEIAAKRRRRVVWSVHTTADITVSPDGRTARLSQGGKRLVARVLRPSAGARFRVESPWQAPPQASNTGVRRLTIRTVTGRKPRPAALSRLRLAVRLRPAGAATPTRLRALSRW